MPAVFLRKIPGDVRNGGDVEKSPRRRRVFLNVHMRLW